MKRLNVKEAIERILARRDVFHNSDIAEITGLSRQAVHLRLRELVRNGELAVVGQGRTAGYRSTGKVTLFACSYRREGLAEDTVWLEVRPKLDPFLDAEGERQFQYALTELVNNAIEHSEASQIEVSCWMKPPSSLVLCVEDDGIGIFQCIQRRLALEDLPHALQELSKGKLTTQPERHSGEGIFFTSKLADRFELESADLRWSVDNRVGDMTVLVSQPERRGTRVWFEASLPPARRLEEIFARYTSDFRFNKTRTVVKLFQIGTAFVSRSEARRLLHGLERFDEVILDFKDVEAVGQGFVDEVFRVFANAHPSVRLIPESMSPSVEFMVKRGLPGGG